MAGTVMMSSVQRALDGARDTGRSQSKRVDQLVVGSRMDETRAPLGIERVERDHPLERARKVRAEAPVMQLEKILENISVVLLGQTDQTVRCAEIDEQIFVDRRHIDNRRGHVSRLAQP